MSYFNEDQEDEMRWLASLKPEEKFWCGWYRVGRCNTPLPCPPGVSMADRIRETCSCGRYPGKPGRTLFHGRGCTKESTIGKEDLK